MALRIQQMACAKNNSMVLLSDGSVWVTGNNTYGQMGNGTMQDRSGWFSVMPSGSDVVQVVAGGYHALALKADGSVWATGHNEQGQMGDGTMTNKKTWTCVLAAGTDIIQVAAGTFYSLALKSDGSVWATGHNEQGQLGDGTTTGHSNWKSVIPARVVQVAASFGHSLALKSDGSLWATGQNEWGQLGNGKTTKKSTWISVMSSGVTQVAVGEYHSLALKSDGAVWAVGNNQAGQIGDWTTMNKSTWTSVIPSGVTQVAAGRWHSLALKSDGSVWATGDNEDGQLGDGTITHSNDWKSVMAAGSGVIRLAAGAYHSLALKSDGTLWKTGTNKFGQLGHEGGGSTVWIPDRFFERLLLESLLIDPPRSRRKLNEPGDDPDVTTGSPDDWQGLSL
jgi:alpha-tubulin suppressor-like RCC1 family protein